MRYILIFLYFFSVSYVNAQSANFDPNIVIKSSIDTTSVKIGEEIIYTIDIISKINTIFVLMKNQTLFLSKY